MKKILITGSSGFIGGFLIQEALGLNFEVYAGIRSTSSKRYLQDGRINFVTLDFSNPQKLQSQLVEFKKEKGKFDYIVHNAGTTKAKDDQEYYLVNCQYTKNFVEALQEAGMVPGKFIYISSLAAYGPGNETDFEPIRNKHIPHPVTAYGRSKLESEKYLISLTNFPFVILRPTVVYGPRDKNLLMVFKMINNHFEVFLGSSEQRLTFVYVKDLARAVYSAIQSKIINQGYFVTDGNNYRIKTFTHLIKRNLGKRTLSLRLPIPLVKLAAFLMEKIYGFSGEVPAFNREKVNELTALNWTCETQPFYRDMKFKAQYDLDKGVAETIDWYKQEKWL
ncbi:MAG: NAD(P)-dependent oxidoreductase [Bacteroidetes bacterium]|nr:NAD(P)-dependent oxidoreductase [Bacteroidota bacterium]